MRGNYYYLQDTGAEIINSLQGISDDFIAFQCLKRKSFGIISNNTDFLIFPGLKVIFFRLMSLKYENEMMKLPFVDTEDPGKIFSNFERFECPIVTQEKVLQILKVNVLFVNEIE